jgi:tetratricopeptide (TPR) repeat protein
LAEELCWDQSSLMDRVFLRDFEILRIEKGLEVIKKYMVRSPQLGQLWLHKGDVYFDIKKWDLAIDAYKEAQ